MANPNFETSNFISYHYSSDHWALLAKMRQQALVITSLFHSQGFECLTYGSIARGDISPTSDIDIVLRDRIPSYRIEFLMENAGIPFLGKYLVQSTPNDVIKTVYDLEYDIHLVLLMTDFTSLAFEFYFFGGALTHNELQQNLRKPGVNKALYLIEPIDSGHIESPLVDRQNEAPKILGVSRQMVQQRIRVLNRREKIGRTGVFLHHELLREESPETVLHELAKQNRLIRKRLQLK